MVNITKNFTLEELYASDTARTKGINNRPTTEAIGNLTRLTYCLLQPLRDKLGKPIIITSGYRSPALNKAIGGAPTSQHCKGEAADLYSPGMTIKELYNFVKSSGLEYDQMIEEGTWLHLSYRKGHNRKENLLYRNKRYIKDN